MQWLGGRESGNIEDRRGMGPVGVGGLGAGGVILALIGYFVFGINPNSTMSAMSGGGAGVEQQQGARGSPTDEAGRFVDVIETNVDDVWTQIFRQKGQQYQPPAGVVLYDQSTGTGCGLGQTAMGPFYCPNDQKVYLDLAFWQELSGRFGAQGEAARAYVIAHEMGHHVQNLLGTMDQAHRLGARGAESGSVRLELQADCFAGIWANRANAAGRIEPGEVQQALNAASAIGDDRLQRQAQGYVVPDSFTHGTSAQRVHWFRTGLDAGSVRACDTFNGRP
jgi:predicted metalloprotease